LIRAILACDEDWGIGKDNALPWPHNPSDLAWFKQCTIGGVVVMGRRTWDSLPNKPLPNRNNVIITSEEKPTYGPYHFVQFNSYKSTVAQMSKLQNIWIIGGSQLINNSLDIIDEFWLSRISGTYECDTYLPRDIIKISYKLYSTESTEDNLCVEKWRKI